MENDLIFKDIYEPIKFKMINFKGEEFECQTQFRTMEDNIEMEKLTRIEYDEELSKTAGNQRDETQHEP